MRQFGLALGLFWVLGSPVVGAEPEMVWTDVRTLQVEGQGWKDVANPFDRFPARAKDKVPSSVWDLSRQSAGIVVRFRTDSPTLFARWTLTSSNLAMNHMAATGVSGLDLYTRQPGDANYRWLSVGRPQAQNNEAILTRGLPVLVRDYLLYLPLYNGVSRVEIGAPKLHRLEATPARPVDRQKPLVFYGTSITQGGCASRTGMVHTAILGRRFDRPVINLGFSGNGRMDAGVGELMGELDAAVFVIDCLPNMSPEQVAERTGPLVAILRKSRPTTPILLVEDRTFANAAYVPATAEGHARRRAELRKAFATLVAAGDKNLHLLAGDKLIGGDGEGTVDGSHPTDLGFQRQAEVFAEALAPLLPQPASASAPIEAYTDQQSYQPGDTLALHVSSQAPTFDLEIVRLGSTSRSVFTQKGIAGHAYAIPADASSHGCQWPVGYKLELPTDWESGYYICKMSGQLVDGKMVAQQAPFVLRSAQPGKNTKILLQLATNTYNAYCNWGGYSLYAYNGRDHVQGRRVSFNRPIAGQFATWEHPFVAWAEKAGYKLDYAVNADLEFRPELLKNYRLVLSVGHDEYWSAPMRDHLEAFIARGGNAAFFSGNTCCWQVRSEENGRALTCFKQAFRDDPVYPTGDHRLLTSLWSHYLVARPENTLTGVGFLWGGYRKSHGQFMNDRAEYTVHRPEHWLFAGAHLQPGAVFGDKDTVVGYECDGCELTWNAGLPEPTGRDGTPKDFTVVATCPVRWHPDDCEWYEKWTKGRTGHAVLGTYTKGGTVVTVGSTDWSHGLRGADPVVIQVTRNVLDRLGK